MTQYGRENEGPLPDALAYFLTWATYGTWLPGDERGWIWYRKGWQPPDPVVKRLAETSMSEDACTLDPQQRALAEMTIAEHCQIRRWTLHAVNCRSTHLHVVVTADRHPDEVREQFKAWCTRRLKELERSRHNTNPTSERGSAEQEENGDETPSLARRVSVGGFEANPTRQRGTPIPVREQWWAERGSKRFIGDEDSLEAAILYVRDGQDRKH